MIEILDRPVTFGLKRVKAVNAALGFNFGIEQIAGFNGAAAFSNLAVEDQFKSVARLNIAFEVKLVGEQLDHLSGQRGRGAKGCGRSE